MNPADVLAVHLLWGKPRTIGSLAEALNWPRRMVEQAITDLRLSGRPVASDGHGVWLATTAAEMADQYRRLRSRYISQALTARAVRATARRMERAEQKVEQQTIWEAA